MEVNYRKKYETLLDTIRPYGRAAVAFSGGTDSSLLAYAAAEALGRDNVLCVTARAASFPEREIKEAEEFCRSKELTHIIFDFDELGIPGFSENPPDRCYLCKSALFTKIIELADDAEMTTVFEGSNTGDSDDYRPGMRAVSEMFIESPLKSSGLNKSDIRMISKELNLPAWDKQPFACLSSRFVYGEEITSAKLDMVGKAEQFLLERGFSPVRVRIQGKDHYTARIEVLKEDISRFLKGSLQDDTAKYFRDLGFSYVTLDLLGYRTGSMNEVLFQR